MNGGTVAPRHVPFDGAQGKQSAPGCRTPNHTHGQTLVVAVVALRFRSGQAVGACPEHRRRGNISVLSVPFVVRNSRRRCRCRFYIRVIRAIRGKRLRLRLRRLKKNAVAVNCFSFPVILSSA